MKLVNNLIATGVLAALGTSAAFAAAPVVPPQPGVIPGTGLPTNTNNGPLFVGVFDITTGSSIAQYLGLGYNDVGVADMSISGTSLDFGVVSGFATTFATAIAENRVNTLQWYVVAADQLADPSIGDPVGYGLRATGAANFETIMETQNDPFGVSATATALNNFYRDTWNPNLDPVTQCARANPCSVVGLPDNPKFLGNPFGLAGGSLGGAIPGGTSFGGTVGSALAFFEAVSVGITFGAEQDVLVTQATGQWLLDEMGRLTYTVGGGTPIPLPAAAWLLLSGVAGLGAVARRRKDA